MPASGSARSSVVGIMAFGVDGPARRRPGDPTAPRSGSASWVSTSCTTPWSRRSRVRWAFCSPAPCPAACSAPVRAGLFASIVVILVGWAALRGYGRDQVPDNPTVDPLNYGTAVLTVLLTVWAAVALWAGFAIRRSRRGIRA